MFTMCSKWNSQSSGRFLGRARGGADDAGFDERDPQRGKQQNAADKENERHRIANGAATKLRSIDQEIGQAARIR